jgi:hypothetical protein
VSSLKNFDTHLIPNLQPRIVNGGAGDAAGPSKDLYHPKQMLSNRAAGCDVAGVARGATIPRRTARGSLHRGATGTRTFIIPDPHRR